jgi:hypothetical protein
VNLVEINDLDVEAAQAVLDFAADRIGAQASPDVALFIPKPAAIGEDIRPRA